MILKGLCLNALTEILPWITLLLCWEIYAQFCSAKMKLYFLEKLSEINLRMATHEGDAIRRLANEAVNLILLPTTEVPLTFRQEFNKLKSLAQDTIKNLISPGLTPTRLCGIQNRTAVKYIKLLIDIEDRLRSEENCA